MAKRTSAYERLTKGNRKQRKELQRRLYCDDPGLEVIHPHAAGIDIAMKATWSRCLLVESSHFSPMRAAPKTFRAARRTSRKASG